MIDLVTIGWLTTDDIVLADGTYLQRVLGGGSLYSAIGAQMWNDHVGLQTVAGHQSIDKVRAEIAARGLDTMGIIAIDGNGLRMWILHESETAKQQIRWLSSSTPTEMDAARGRLPESYWASARGFHVAPQGSAGTISTIRELCALPSRPIVTVDIVADDYAAPASYRDMAFLDGVTAFVPSNTEIERLWSPAKIEDWVAEQAAAHGCHIAAKLGDRGSLVFDAASRKACHVPALSVDVLDTTGAGDAYCGGFLAGLVAGRPLAECAAMATVSASYVVQARGALATPKPDPNERDERLRTVLSRIAWQ
jgi:sugar/nucleoside kinase (ribokinase family)